MTVELCIFSMSDYVNCSFYCKRYSVTGQISGIRASKVINQSIN